MRIPCVSLFLETYQHLSKERPYNKCTQKPLFHTHNKGNPGVS